MKSSVLDIDQQLINLVQQLLLESEIEYSQRQITLNDSLTDLGIDSLGRAELLQRIEKNFNVRLPDNLIAEVDLLRDIAKAIIESAPAHKIDRIQPVVQMLEQSTIDPKNAHTLIDVLLLYAKHDPSRPHIYLQDEYGNEEIITYGKLLENSRRVAHSLLKRGLAPGDTVAIMQPTNPGFFYTFFGTLLINCIPVPIYPPFRPHQIEAYAKQEAKILQNAEVRILVTFHEAENLSKLLRNFIPSLREITTANSLLNNQEKAAVYEAKADDFAMIQYTSGSTSTPKGVLLTHYNLLSNIRAYGQAIQVTHKDVSVSWAPLYHDLGLIGMWFGSLYHGIPLTLMSPLTFLNRPERWLWAIHRHRGTISGGPNFAYELCINKIQPEQIEGLDLSSWRAAFNGAEAIQPKTLARFTEKFAPYGFRPETHLPVYGLAESTVCVAVSPLNRSPRIDKVERKALEEELQAKPTTDDSGQNSLEFVACGKPIPDHQVRIVDDKFQPLPDRHVGLLQFSGPSSMQGYYANPEATRAIYHNGWWDSGDLAYIADGEIFITGRKKDVIIKAGRNLYPPEVEDLTAQIPDIRKGCVIAFGTSDPQRGTEKLIIVAETRDKKPKHPGIIIEKITKNIINALDVAPDQIILVPPQTIPKTSSGKLQRSACKAAFLAGKLKKHRVPMWWQIAKLSLTSFWTKTRRRIIDLGRFFYTIYGAILIASTLIPVLIFLWIFPSRLSAYICKYWSRLLFILMFCPIHLEGKKFLYQAKPLIFAANHASYVDALLLLGILPPGTRFVGKKELKDSWLTGIFIRRLHYITVDRTDLPQGLEDTKQIETVIKQGNSIAIFPEGTFGYATGLRPFKFGAFKIAAETNTPICPVAIRGTRYILRDEERLLKPGRIQIIVSEPTTADGKEWHDITKFKNKIRTQIAKDSGEASLDLIITPGKPNE